VFNPIKIKTVNKAKAFLSDTLYASIKKGGVPKGIMKYEEVIEYDKDSTIYYLELSMLTRLIRKLSDEELYQESEKMAS